MSDQKVWFITGASRGLGFEIAKAVLASGNKVVATSRNIQELSAIGNLGDANDILLTRLDVTNEREAKDAARLAIETFGRIDVLVNNAGYGLLSAIEEASDIEIRQLYEVNVFGLLHVTRAILPYLRKQRSGHVINMSSGGGLSGTVGWGLYGSTKFAVEGITETLALELAPLGIHATAIEPGFFRTNFLDGTSLAQSKTEIEDYAETVGKMRTLATQFNKLQPGDPAKLAQAILSVANVEYPPVHLPLGNDTLAAYRAKTDAFQKEIQGWLDVITNTDYDEIIS
ncbi:oxidoreductase [Paenibacillus radicis (ex Xue et al. 2023)]|uniref:Oxidoreductase n=1 Tax=Paenibacillus radicis (ex Xue et al. 2023) TaxID=2972489 RepID=A0ABT1YG85_9BACL|nr:oxidoreductase [Paenibacillus radicis (ex Xue et al. 2023)]MCR8632206.1 oxidoreductase [Paenibacillus radicis (ex Xue et al. 2023)]